AADKLVVERTVLIRQRVDRRIKKILRNAQSMRECGRREQRSVATLHKRQQKIPDLTVGMGRVNVAAPDPASASLLARRHQAERLRVMNHDEILVELNAAAILLRYPQERFKVLRPVFEGPAMDGIVKGLGCLEKLFIALNHFPVCLDSHLAQQGNDAGEYFGDAAAGAAGVDHLDRLVA